MNFENIYVVNYNTWRYGNSTYLVKCNHYPSDEEVIKALEIEYEPDKEESLDVMPLNLVDFVTIK